MANTGKTSGKPGAVAGYGLKGNAFKNPAKYNASKSGQLHAKNPGLSTKPVGKGVGGNAFFSQNKFNASKAGQMSGKGAPPGGYQAHPAGSGSAAHNPSVPKMPGSYHGLTSGATPMKNAGRGRAGI